MSALARSGSELLDPSTVTQCEVQVGHRYRVHMCARMGVCALARVLNYWILAPLHSVRYRLVIIKKCMCAPSLARVVNYWILALLHSVRYRLVIVKECICALAWVCPRSGS